MSYPDLKDSLVRRCRAAALSHGKVSTQKGVTIYRLDLGSLWISYVPDLPDLRLRVMLPGNEGTTSIFTETKEKLHWHYRSWDAESWVRSWNDQLAEFTVLDDLANL